MSDPKIYYCFAEYGKKGVMPLENMEWKTNFCGVISKVRVKMLVKQFSVCMLTNVPLRLETMYAGHQSTIPERGCENIKIWCSENSLLNKTLILHYFFKFYRDPSVFLLRPEDIKYKKIFLFNSFILFHVIITIKI